MYFFFLLLFSFNIIKNGYSVSFQYDVKYATHDIRPKNLHLKSATSTTNVPSQDLLLGSYFGNNCKSEQQQQQHTATAAVDLDINVHAIKNMLMANRVPESCVQNRPYRIECQHWRKLRGRSKKKRREVCIKFKNYITFRLTVRFIY